MSFVWSLLGYSSSQFRIPDRTVTREEASASTVLFFGCEDLFRRKEPKPRKLDEYEMAKAIWDSLVKRGVIA